MEFFSSSYWQAGENASALILQQCLCGDTPILFACVCGGQTESEGRACGYFSRRLLEWFRSMRFSRAVGNPDAFLKKQEVKLKRLLQQVDNEVEQAGLALGEVAFDKMESLPKRNAVSLPGRNAGGKPVSLSGILCIGQEFLLFGRGNTGITLLNRCMGNPHVENMPRRDILSLQLGVMEPDVGVLLATKPFTDSIPREALQEGLFVEEVVTERQTEKHLRELGRAGEENGGKNMAAVLFYIRPDKAFLPIPYCSNIIG